MKQNNSCEMSNVPTAPCACPSCKQNGRSVAAINNSETHFWHISRTFTSEDGVIMASKRAKTFAEPERYALPIMALLLASGFVAGASSCNAQIFPVLLASSTPQSSIVDKLYTLIQYLSPCIVIAVMAGAYRNLKEEDKLNVTEYPNRLARYNELKYCETCNLLYDLVGNYRPANEIGFNEMMATSP